MSGRLDEESRLAESGPGEEGTKSPTGLSSFISVRTKYNKTVQYPLFPITYLIFCFLVHPTQKDQEAFFSLCRFVLS